MRTCGDRPAVIREKEAVSGSCSEQDDQRFRIHLVRPRAEAHSWGRGARILTEINRLPQRQAKITTIPALADCFSTGPGSLCLNPLPLLLY
jgi:hypothetical protein